MGIRKSAAEAVSAVSTAALKHLFRRPAGNFPGKMALYIDPSIIEEMAAKLGSGSICICGTNGKTTVTNMLADCLEAAGQKVVCNRTGANLDSGVATSLLHASKSDWGVFECDELWLAKILPYLQSRYVLLLNLFPDQLDRVGEIDRIQESIVSALEASPNTVLVYNADDPHCEYIARRVPNPNVPIGLGEEVAFARSEHEEAQLCQCCDGVLGYRYRLYSQLGDFSCNTCDFARVPLRFFARNCQLDAQGMSFDVMAAVGEDAVAGGALSAIKAPYAGVYMVYNLLAVYVAAHLLGLSNHVVQLTVNSYNPQNGRLESMEIYGRSVLLNLAKNPTGFNQNLSLIMQEDAPVAVAFFVNDKEGDGRDVSWIWDVGFEDLAKRPNTVVYVGGMRGNDLQVRLKYAGVPSILVESTTEAMSRVAALPQEYRVYLIANYTSLPTVREECVKMRGANPPIPSMEMRRLPDPLPAPALEGDPVRILHLFPDILGLFGDEGNVSVLEKRLEWRGIPVKLDQVLYGQDIDFSQADIVFIGGGADRGLKLACEQLMGLREELRAYAGAGGVLLATGGGFQILGKTWCAHGQQLEGLGLLDVEMEYPQDGEGRIVGDLVVQSPCASMPVVGYENHMAQTRLSSQAEPFGTVLKGAGNNEQDSSDGVRAGNVLATFLHGPLLGKNPQVADWIIGRALERRGRFGQLADLDDGIELAANEYMCKRLGV